MKELTIPIQAHGSIPLYGQIYEYIKREITDGRIPSGERLPSTRLLASQLSVSRSTVDLAYGQLQSEGYVDARPGSGYYVCDIQNIYHQPATPNAEVAGLPAPRRWRWDFSPNEVEWSDFSMEAWRKSMKSVMQEDMKPYFASGAPQGEENLRQAIRGYLRQARGVDCQVGQIVVGAGNEYLLMLLYQILGGGCSIAMESPTYRQAYQIFQNLGWRVLPTRMDESGMLPQALREGGAKLAYVMPSHQFPMGSVMPMKRRMELLEWAAGEEGRYIIEDDYDSEFHYRGRSIPSLQGSAPWGSVIYLGTFSKSIAPAVRVSYMVLPLELTAPYQERCGSYASAVPRLQQQILCHFIQDGYFERHLNKMRSIYRGRHDALLLALRGKRWVRRIEGEDAGLHVLVELATPHAEEEVVSAAMERGLRVYGLGEYSIQGQLANRPPTLLLGYAGMDEQRIAEGVAVLGEVLDEMEKGGCQSCV